MTKISIIIPIYNVERWLGNCLKSIQEQGFIDYEVLMVDDRSPDNSDVIAKSYVNSDERFKYYLMEQNVGQGFARNYGMKKAVGEYIVFVDSDDYLTEDALQKWWNLAQKSKSDIAYCHFEKHVETSREDSHIAPGDFLKVFNTTSMKTHWGKPNFHVIPNCWQAIYKKSFLDSNNIRFDLRHREDNPFTINALLQTKKVAFSDDICTRYRIRFIENANEVSVMQRSFDSKEATLMIHQLDLIVGYFSRSSNVLSATFQYEELLRLAAWRLWHFYNKVFFDLRNESGSAEVSAFIQKMYTTLKSNLFGRFGNELLEAVWGASGKNAGAVFFNALLKEGLIDEAIYFYLFRKIPYQRVSSVFEMGLPDHIVERFHNFVINIDTPPSMFRKKFPEVIIHIGKTKCGSSYLQNKLLHNKDALLKQGILFPDTGLYFEPDNETRTSGHNDFKAVFYKTGHEAITLQNKLLRELDKQTDNVSTLLISCENISFEGVNFPFNAFKRFWGNASIKVVICTRDEDAWNSSMYTEAVSGGHLKYTKSLDDFREEMRVTGALENEGLVAFWEEALGQENVEHISLSSEDGKRVPLWDTFCERVGIDNPSSFEDIPEEKSNITRISYEITTCFRLINLLPFESAASYLSFVQQAKRQCVALSEEDAQDKGHIMEMMINEYRTRGTKPKQNGKPQPLKKDFRGANQLEVVQNELHAVLNSKSWKITAPLRYIFKLLGGR